MIPWAHVSQPLNGISIGSVGFAQLTSMPKIHTDHAACDICSNRPYLCTAYRRCGLKIQVKILKLATALIIIDVVIAVDLLLMLLLIYYNFNIIYYVICLVLFITLFVYLSV